MSRLLSRLWRVPLRHAVLIALPFQMLVAWNAYEGLMAYEVLADYGRKNTFFGEPTTPFSTDQWRYFARDAFRKDVSGMIAPAVPVEDGLETFSLMVNGTSLSLLNSNLPASGKEAAQPALLEAGEDRLLVKARYMGDNHWHWLFPQKSWRIRTRKGEAFRDRREINLKNPPSLLAIDETLITRLSDELGVLSPEVEPIKFLLNGTYGGLYLRWDIADESLLRRERRMPGSIYQGENAPPDEHGVSSLFRDAKFWEKIGARNAEQAENRKDIEALIDAINGPPERFHEFAERHLAMDRFASFLAIERLFGGRHHDYNHNHKYYFDPYKGRFEPIQWDFGSWHYTYDQRSFDATEQPLLSALKRHPDLELRIQRALLRLARMLTPDELNRRLDDLVRLATPALLADSRRDFVDWGARRDLKLNVAPCVHFDYEEYLAERDRRSASFAKLHAGASRDLRDSRCEYTFSPGEIAKLEFAAGGHVAMDWFAVALRASGRVSIWQDRDLDGLLGPGDPLVASADAGSGPIPLGERLYPGLEKVPTINGMPFLYGTFDLAPSPLCYRYFLRGDGVVEDVASLSLRNALTGDEIEAKRVAALPPAKEIWSLHPWKLPMPKAPDAVTLGPGVVDVPTTRRFESTTSVTIAAGTTLRLGPGASLMFSGRVQAVGTAEAPISFEPLERDRPWGVVLLHGQATAGSRFAHCRWRDGSMAEHDLMVRTGMFSVIDTKDISMEHCFVGRNHVGDDAVHWGYVEEGAIRACRFEGARSDALDMDICTRILVEDCEFADSGNDCMDLMTSEVRVSDCRFTRGGDKGISVGESTNLRVERCRFLRCVTGIEIKDESVARVDETSLFEACAVGINLYRKNPRYSRGGILDASALRVVDSARADVTWDKLSVVPEAIRMRFGREKKP
ncbi:MAG: hypothetical protein Fur0037_07130 [Planctomycetota bacterium]